jgi:membrane protease YdiL (CAAX protease family)
VNDSLSTISPAWPTRWPKDSFSSPWTWVLATVVVAILTLAFILGLKTSGAPVPQMSPILLDIVFAFQFVVEGLFVLGILLAVPRLSKFSLRDLGFRAPDARAIGIGVAGALAMIVVANGGASLIDTLAHSKHQQDVVEIFKNLHDPVTIAIFVVFAVLFAPFAEESIFRVFFFNLGLRFGGFWAGAIVSGFMFGLAHGDLYAAIPLALGGIVLSYVYYSTRNAFASMISHGLFNTFSIVMLLVAPNLTQ